MTTSLVSKTEQSATFLHNTAPHCMLSLTASYVLGGGTRNGFLADAILQLICIPILISAVWKLLDRPLQSSDRLVWALWSGLILVPVAQIVPLPPSLWTLLPQRSHFVAEYALIGLDLPWLPISVSPNSTQLALLSLIPPLAVFTAAIQLNNRQRQDISLVLLALVTISVMLGFVQLSQGPDSDVRFFAFTNKDDAVGFFANRNHFSASLYALLLISAVWAWEMLRRVEILPQSTQFRSRAVFFLMVSFIVFVLLLFGQVMARSRMGIGLSVIALFGILAFAPINRNSNLRVVSRKFILFGAVVFTFFGLTQYALYRFAARFADDPLKDWRVRFADNTFEAAKAFMPFGSGVGTFIYVYPIFEKPHDALLDAYANRAHNDFLEMLLETGAFGLVMLSFFVIWFSLSAFRAWARPIANSQYVDVALARAASVGIALLIVHSAVDYPLRTNAVMGIFAFFCALLVGPPLAEGNEAELEIETTDRDNPRKQGKMPTTEPAQTRSNTQTGGWIAEAGKAWPDRIVAAPTPAVQQDQVGARWGEGVDWPEEWLNGNPTKKPRDSTEPL